MSGMVSLARLDDADDLLGRFFSEFLDEAAFAGFRRIERLFEGLKAQGKTVSGYPLIRPSDCGQITQALDQIFEHCRPQFRTHDIQITERFEELIGEFCAFCRSVYPGEATGALILHGKVLLFMERADSVIDLVSHYALRPYAIEDNLGHCMDLMDLFAKAHLLRGTLAEQPISFIAFGVWLNSNPRGPSAMSVAVRMAPYAVCERPHDTEPLLYRMIRRASVEYMRVLRGHAGILRKLAALGWVGFWRLLLALCYLSLAGGARFRAPFSPRMNRAGGVLVTRAMGGIGDQLMMEPGLEALAAKHGRPVDFAIARKFFPIFANNPHVRLVDINGPAIDVSAYREFVNLSLCPASIYESRNRPHIKRGRVEVFARAMGISRRALRRQGWRINQFMGEAEQAFCDDFLAERGLGDRPIVGVQPYSRDSYKDHPEIGGIIAALAREYDVIVFHHVADGLPQNAGIVTTAGLPLGCSLALISRLQAMVSVDSAFLHAVSAYDIPLVGLFGPTGARPLTRHHRKVTVLWKPQTFGCVPCWRNEDTPCSVTGLLSHSPCVAAITPDEVLRAVADAIAGEQS